MDYIGIGSRLQGVMRRCRLPTHGGFHHSDIITASRAWNLHKHRALAALALQRGSDLCQKHLAPLTSILPLIQGDQQGSGVAHGRR